MKHIALLLLSAAVAFPAMAAQPSSKIYAQELIDKTLAKHPELRALAMHVTPPKTTENVIIASNNSARIGQKSDDDDIAVITTGKPLIEVNKAGDGYFIEQVLLDASGRNVGALGAIFPYKAGADKAMLEKQARTIRDELARRISHTANLLEPAQYDIQVPTNTYAQKLVDKMMEKHPELEILCLHVTPPGQTENVIIGSSIGRMGMAGDEDDLRVIATGKTNLEINTEGNRFESEMVIQDVAGKTIGAAGIVFAYKPGDDKEALHKRGREIRDELRAQTPSLAKLVELVKE